MPDRSQGPAENSQSSNDILPRPLSGVKTLRRPLVEDIPMMDESQITDSINETLNSSDSDVYIQPGQGTPPKDDIPMSNTSTPEELIQRTSYVDGHEMTDGLRTRTVNTDPNEPQNFIPTYGRVIPNTPIINVFVRITISIPGEAITKPMTNPHTVTSYKFAIPNTFQTAWYEDTRFITAMVQSAQVALDSSFPFANFRMLNLLYKLEPVSIFYNFARENVHYFHRINLQHLLSLDSELRREHIHLTTPKPSTYKTTMGTIFEACYDIIFLCSDVRHRPLKDQPPNRNEQLLLDGINLLASEKTEAIPTIARVLTLYNDYRLNAHKKPNPIPKPNENPYHLEDDPAVLQYQQQQMTQTPRLPSIPEIVIEPDAIHTPKPPQMLYVPPAKRIPQPTPMQLLHMQHMSQIQMAQEQQQLMQQFYTSPYETQEELLPPTIPQTRPILPGKVRGKRRNIQLDPTIPWDKGFKQK